MASRAAAEPGYKMVSDPWLSNIADAVRMGPQRAWTLRLPSKINRGERVDIIPLVRPEADDLLTGLPIGDRLLAATASDQVGRRAGKVRVGR